MTSLMEVKKDNDRRHAKFLNLTCDMVENKCGGPGMERGRGIPLFSPLVMLSQSEALF